jgi:hypothetical protein
MRFGIAQVLLLVLVGARAGVAGAHRGPCDIQIDDQLKPRWLLDGKVSWLGSLENLVDIVGTVTKYLGEVRRVRHEPAGRHVVSIHEHGGEVALGGDVDEPSSCAAGVIVSLTKSASTRALVDPGKGISDVAPTSDGDVDGLESQGRSDRAAASFRSSSRFPLISASRSELPVTFPPGRARFGRSPLPTGSAAPIITIGIVDVARSAA